MLLPYKNRVSPCPQRMTLHEAHRLQALYHALAQSRIVHLEDAPDLFRGKPHPWRMKCRKQSTPAE